MTDLIWKKVCSCDKDFGLNVIKAEKHSAKKGHEVDWKGIIIEGGMSV